MSFSERKKISDEAEQWLADNCVPESPLNVITALDFMGFVVAKPESVSPQSPPIEVQQKE